MTEINYQSLISPFDKKWIGEIKMLVTKYLKESDGILNKQYFTELGDYYNRNDSYIDPKISDYFDRLLFAPNLAILDFVIKNYEKVKDLKFIDNGAGLGLLSLFLKKIDIECYNYDNFSQINNVTFDKYVFDRFKIEINPITNKIPIDCDFLVCSGIWVDNKEFLNRDLKYVILDKNHENKGIGPQLKERLELIDSYNTILVYGKK
jgi:hypothetical protein